MRNIFDEATGIGYDRWDLWNPIYNETDPLVTCGPFIFSEFFEHDHCSLIRNPTYHYAKVIEAVTTTTSITTTTSTTSTTTTTTQREVNEWLIAIAFAVPAGGIIVIYIFATKYPENKRLGSS